MKTPRQILEQEWYKKTDTPFTDQTADHLRYALDAMEIYATQFSEGGGKSNSVLHSISSHTVEGLNILHGLLEVDYDELNEKDQDVVTNIVERCQDIADDYWMYKRG